jgi:hypothetical protein
MLKGLFLSIDALILSSHLVAMEAPRKFENCKLNLALKLFEDWGSNLSFGRSTNELRISELKQELIKAIEKDSKMPLWGALVDINDFMVEYSDQLAAKAGISKGTISYDDKTLLSEFMPETDIDRFRAALFANGDSRNLMCAMDNVNNMHNLYQ